MQRLATFANYRNDKNVFVCKLSKAGFCYEGYDNALECESCKFKCNSWTDLSDLFRQHAVYSPGCQFVKGCNNQQDHPQNRNSTQNASEDSFQRNDELPRAHNSNCKTVIQKLQTDSSHGNNAEAKQVFETLGIHFDRPKYPSYAVLATRITSFSTAGHVFYKSSSDMAQAGFFFKGYSDHVCCFSCGGGLSQWQPEDDPWIEHAYWFPQCPFLDQNKGREFVQQVQLMKEVDENQGQGQIASVPGGNGGFHNGSDEIDSIVLSNILEMGFTEDQIKEAFTLWKSWRNLGNVQQTDLIEILLQQEDGISLSCTSAPENHGSNSLIEDQPCSYESLSNEIDTMQLTDLQSVQKEYKELQEMTICKVCKEKSVSIVFLPCGHIVTCAECAPAMRKCPMCREFVKGTVKTFLS